jgi:hypothetical protein
MAKKANIINVGSAHVVDGIHNRSFQEVLLKQTCKAEQALPGFAMRDVVIRQPILTQE